MIRLFFIFPPLSTCFFMSKAGAFLILLVFISSTLVTAQISVTRIATQLNNPRGIAVLSEQELVLVEAGTGEGRTGQVSRLTDLNEDGDFDDAGERQVLADNFPSYNGLTMFGTGHDEVGGVGDIVLAGEAFFITRDHPRAAYLADGTNNDIRVQAMSLDGDLGKTLLRRDVTLNSLVFDEVAKQFYIVESGNNAITRVKQGEAFEYVTVFLPLNSNQQSVPAGIAINPTTGHLLVALFSGQVFDEGNFLSYKEGEAKIVSVDPETGEQSDLITGLTTVVDVAADEAGNIFVLELTSGAAIKKLERDFPLYSADAAPLAGGYPRKKGRLSMFDPVTKELSILVDNLDAPTNLSYFEAALYISTGQGTPGRGVEDEQGNIMKITGALYKVEGF